jgi:hypothetical protein
MRDFRGRCPCGRMELSDTCELGRVAIIRRHSTIAAQVGSSLMRRLRLASSRIARLCSPLNFSKSKSAMPAPSIARVPAVLQLQAWLLLFYGTDDLPFTTGSDFLPGVNYQLVVFLTASLQSRTAAWDRTTCGSFFIRYGILLSPKGPKPPVYSPRSLRRSPKALACACACL